MFAVDTPLAASSIAFAAVSVRTQRFTRPTLAGPAFNHVTAYCYGFFLTLILTNVAALEKRREVCTHVPRRQLYFPAL